MMKIILFKYNHPVNNGVVWFIPDGSVRFSKRKRNGKVKYMRNTYKKIIAAMTASLLLISMSGCATSKSKKEDTSLEDVEEYIADAYISDGAGLALNDYRGAVLRTMCLRDLVLNKVDAMKAANVSIRQEQPNSYWNVSGYQDFVTTFINENIINDTKWFTEEEFAYQHPHEWEWVVWCMQQEPSTFTSADGNSDAFGQKKDTGYDYPLIDGVKVVRNEKDDYSVSGLQLELEGVKLLQTVSGGMTKQSATYSGDAVYRALYDCDKDWAKTTCTVSFKEKYLPSITASFYEYMRVNDNTFAIQTSRERLYVVLDPVETDTPMNQRTVKEFYYSKLVKEGARTSYKSFVPMSTYDPKTGKYNKEAQSYNETMREYAFLNDKGDVANLYGARDSVLLRADKESITRDWVFEETSLDQALVYKDGAFVATTYNKLAEQYDQFVYYMNDTPEETVNELKGLVDIEALVGILAVPETDLSVTEAVNPYNNYTLEEMEVMELTYDKEFNVVDSNGRVVVSVWDGKQYENAKQAREAAAAKIMNETKQEETTEESVEETETESESEESTEEEPEGEKETT